MVDVGDPSEAAEWIRQNNFSKVGLQLPDDALEQSRQLCSRVEQGKPHISFGAATLHKH